MVESGRDNPGTAPLDETLVLDVADLLPDEAGEVVLVYEDDWAVNLVTDAKLHAEGLSESHVTVTGLDVTGQHYYSFDNGITIYSVGEVAILPQG